MNYSEQQNEVIHHEGDMVVNAVAGSGKTSTLAGYAQHRSSQKLLYLAFNKSVKQEAEEKFRKLGLGNVRVETAHSLALRNYPKSPRISQSGYQPFDVKQLLGFQFKDAIADMKFGKHVLQMVAAFCNSKVRRVMDLEYNALLVSAEEKAFVKTVYDQLVHETRRFLGMMQSDEIEMTHDFYLKAYQLSSPRIENYDCILFDEAQDASPVMLDVVMNQSAVKVLVGDEHQQIYGWRYAVNALQQVDYTRKYLTTSYRFNQEIADLSFDVLAIKNHLKESRTPLLKGKGKSSDIKTRATLGRTNGAILVDVIDRLIDKEEFKSVYFEGHFQTYTYADEGGSVYDVLNLYLDQRKGIRNPMIRQFNDFSELQEYTDQSGDAPMKGIIDIVMTYGRELPHLINCIKDSHVDHNKKDEADMVYSTVHKAKGMEYDQVKLLDDFLGEEKLLDMLKRPDLDPDPNRLIEDINILYVALTRAKCNVEIPEVLIPESYEWENKESIKVISRSLGNASLAYFDESSEQKESVQVEPKKHSNSPNKAYSYEEVRKTKPSAYSSWSLAEDLELEELFANRTPIKQMAEHLGRSRGAIASRIKKLQLREKYFDT
ncbi:MAG: DNA helicase [Flammeovirgaceae bacterium]|nr:DNA helicase [Flammeovirgaceae bacterium]HCX22609.1 DNA helicase [Cytophagales bacterium]